MRGRDDIYAEKADWGKFRPIIEINASSNF